jgi:netrin-G3 ligand
LDVGRVYISFLLSSLVPSGSPTIFRAMDISPTEIVVSWLEVRPIDRNGIIIAYEVDYQPEMNFNDSDTITRVNTTNTTILLMDLHESVEYNITVRAYTSVGGGPFSGHVISGVPGDGEKMIISLVVQVLA